MLLFAKVMFFFFKNLIELISAPVEGNCKRLNGDTVAFSSPCSSILPLSFRPGDIS